MKTPAERVIDLYSRRASDWGADRGRSLMEQSWLNRFLTHVLPAGSVLDLGCGSGEPVARYLVEKGRRVTGVDAAPGLIDLCRTRFPDHDWRVADMRDLDLGRAFDGLIAWHSLFHLTPGDQQGMFAVFARHLTPGGVLMFTSGTDHGDQIGEWRGEPLYHGSLSTEAYGVGLDAADFEVIDTVVNDPDCGGANVWLARRRVSDWDHDRETEQSDRRSHEEGPRRQEGRRRAVSRRPAGRGAGGGEGPEGA